MNILREVERINLEELKSGTEVGKGSWHDEYLRSAYVYVGGLDTALSEGDIICVFSEFGEVIDINYARDSASGEPRGFCFIGYADPRSCVLAVDNMNGVQLCDRILRVDHKIDYRPPTDKEDEKRENPRKDFGREKWNDRLLSRPSSGDRREDRRQVAFDDDGDVDIKR